MDAPVTFDDFAHTNGDNYWLATDFMRLLGYPDLKSFEKPINRATQAMASIGGSVNPHKEMQFIRNQDDDKDDYRLTRFACYMIAMNADPKKREVAMAQVFFAKIAQEMELSIQNQAAQMERLARRREFSEENKALNSVAKGAGVSEFDKFANAGYLGMYNLYNYELAERRGVEKSKLLDHMGSTELAANTFRLALTKEELKKGEVRGQKKAEGVHREVGKDVREMVIKRTGSSPENLPQESLPLPKVKTAARKIHKGMKRKK